MPPRCFLALDLPHPVVASLERARDVFLDRAPAWSGEKWVGPGLLHVTLEFLGPVANAAVDAMLARMGEATSDLAAFEVRLRSVEAAPSQRHATMLWATLDDPAGAIPLLRERLLDALPDPGPSTRPFRPHVTLVRARRPRPVPDGALEAATRMVAESGKEPDGIMSVRSATLYSSTLTRTGPEYRKVAAITWGR